MKKGTRFMVTTAVAAGVGYVAGVLSAPKSGKETRKDIQDKAVHTKEELGKKLEEVNAELNEAITKGKERVKQLQAGAKTEMEQAVSMAVTAKDKAREMLTAVRQSDVEDKDLKNAVKDVNKAIENLRKYLQKNG